MGPSGSLSARTMKVWGQHRPPPSLFEISIKCSQGRQLLLSCICPQWCKHTSSYTCLSVSVYVLHQGSWPRRSCPQPQGHVATSGDIFSGEVPGHLAGRWEWPPVHRTAPRREWSDRKCQQCRTRLRNPSPRGSRAVPFLVPECWFLHPYLWKYHSTFKPPVDTPLPHEPSPDTLTFSPARLTSAASFNTYQILLWIITCDPGLKLLVDCKLLEGKDPFLSYFCSFFRS